MIKQTIIALCFIFAVQAQSNFTFNPKTMQENQYNKLTPDEERVIVHKGTERPFTGVYDNFFETGNYICKRCNALLYKSTTKFDAHCGWAAFDGEVPGAIARIKDADGKRTEIVCARCQAHLGHVFIGEGLTPTNTRHCVNSLSLTFVPQAELDKQEKQAVAYFASGCFWGTEYWFSKAKGVISTAVGYMGGTLANPSYKQVSTGNTGHVEAIKVVYDTEKTTYEELIKLFFETHDPTQTDGQGPDIGTQYLSVIFYTSKAQKEMAEKYKKILSDKGLKVATKIVPASDFYAEQMDYHQKYYDKTGKKPYCHIYTKKF
jgi:peptide methionine sulfoxide reductase msrA/msrB